jgi:hypothetical protein
MSVALLLSVQCFRLFFVSFLVEPLYGEQIATFQELLDSSVNFGFNTDAEFALSTSGFSGHLHFPPTRRVNCSVLKKLPYMLDI